MCSGIISVWASHCEVNVGNIRSERSWAFCPVSYMKIELKPVKMHPRISPFLVQTERSVLERKIESKMVNASLHCKPVWRAVLGQNFRRCQLSNQHRRSDVSKWPSCDYVRQFGIRELEAARPRCLTAQSTGCALQHIPATKIPRLHRLLGWLENKNMCSRHSLEQTSSTFLEKNFLRV